MRFDQVGDGGELAGADHGGLIDHHDRTARGAASIVAKVMPGRIDRPSGYLTA